MSSDDDRAHRVRPARHCSCAWPTGRTAGASAWLVLWIVLLIGTIAGRVARSAAITASRSRHPGSNSQQAQDLLTSGFSAVPETMWTGSGSRCSLGQDRRRSRAVRAAITDTARPVRAAGRT